MLVGYFPKPDRQVVLEAVKQNGLALRCHNIVEFLNDREIVLEAIKQHGMAICSSCNHRFDNEMIMEAVKLHGFASEHTDELYKYRMKVEYDDLYLCEKWFE